MGQRRVVADRLSVIIPASNEAGWIGPCLDALLAGTPPGIAAEVIVVANGCHDATADQARARAGAAAAAGWGLQVIDRPEPGKPGALNAGDAAARGGVRVYLDADVIVSPDLLAQLVAALVPLNAKATARRAADPPFDPAPDLPSDAEVARYATGTVTIPHARSAISRAYGHFWQRLPFARAAAPGYGLFAMNAAGRARWDEWPPIIADDMFARLHFAPAERVQVPATYAWPLVEGFARLIRVRRRQNAGMRELAADWPQLLPNAAVPRAGPGAIARAALAAPAGFIIYVAVALAVRIGRNRNPWARGR